MIFKILSYDDEERYRSRMAETIRLLFHLRQLFPQHDGQNGWTGAKTLVADYRFKRASRAYPERTITPSKFLKNFYDQDKKIVFSLESLFEDRMEYESFKLADFQFEASKAIIESIKSRRNRGILISAGTGSGKTLAFYLPALSRISELIQQDDDEDRWVKVVAIYPRSELLKDQFGEVFKEARYLDKIIDNAGKRNIQIGTLYGPTPTKAAFVTGKFGWEQHQSQDGYICPFVNCIKCAGEMIWSETNIRERREFLSCENEDCDFVINENQIILTRDRLSKNPPDILFTTTEMMNQRLGDPGLRNVFGAQPEAKKPPEILLLDEVHSYQGFSGAQVAFLLRRWKEAVNTPVTFIGLSATLKNGEEFFGHLCGLEDISEIKPLPSQMKKEGAEYTIALRGDPVSRTAILSTTIQTAMLLSRSLDKPNSPVSDGFYGSKLFAFTDKLDVTNRLHPNLLDAEGRDRDGNPNRAAHPNGALAYLREPMAHQGRYDHGQDWRMSEQIGHQLSDCKNITKVSSQDPGVDTNSDVIVATAALEVGFNDTSVGAVIQHKAPRGMTQFIQRKGRAGRTRKMRPWTVVVLSDYGRDRLLYMGYEQLFDPEVPVTSLPIHNRYIIRIQAVYCLIEYLSQELRSYKSRDTVWKWLSQPHTNSQDREFRKALAQKLTKILEDPISFDKFASYIRKNLQLTEDELQPILWDHPRPLMTTVIPTALRRVSTNWRHTGKESGDYTLNGAPLPEFATQTLFSDLNLPEVTLKMPPNDPGDDTSMPVAQAMREFAPGRVSKRFSSRVKHWVIPDDLKEGSCTLNLAKSFELLKLGNWSIQKESKTITKPVFRILTTRLKEAGNIYRDTSNAQLQWHTQIFVSENAIPLSPPGETNWGGLVKNLQVFTHRDQNPIEIRRFADASEAEIKYERGDSFTSRIEFTNNNTPSALGMSMTVDGIRIKINSAFDYFEELNFSEEASRGFKTARYMSAAWSGENFSTIPNPFAREWLANIYMTAVVHEAIKTSRDLKSAAEAVLNETAELSLANVLDTIFQSHFEADPDSEGTIDLPADTLRRDLEKHLDTPEVLRELHTLASI